MCGPICFRAHADAMRPGPSRAVFLHALAWMPAQQQLSTDVAAVFPGDGEMAGRCRDVDWAATSLGSVDSWPDELRVAVRMAIESPFPINLWCGGDLLLIYNDAYIPVLGTKHPRALGRRGHEVWAEIWPAIAPMFERIRAGGPPMYAENARFMMERRQGPPSEAWFTFALSPIRQDDGSIIAFLNIATETTQRVVAERVAEQERAALAESVARYRFLANTIPVQVWTATADGALDFVSERAAAYFGRSAAEVVGDQWLSVLHPDDVDPTMRRWRQSLESGEPYEVEFRLWSAEHERYRWHLGRARAQRDANGGIIGWVGSNTEIEERKQVEAKLQRLTEEATKANDAKSAFLASMSHELRTPLNAIGGYAQLIEMGVRGPINEQQRADLLKIQRSKNHLDRLVSDILSFAKLGAGRVEYEIVRVSVRATVSVVIDMVAPQLEERALRLECDAIPKELDMRADPDKVRQILINLLGNALKFTPAGGTITVRVSATTSDVTVAVSDTGIGVDSDQLDRIFEPFVQSKRAIKASDQGVGLGLAISRQYARAMSGDLRAESENGKGSTFYLTLPRN